MGYCYGPTGALVCDGCGLTGGVRKRTCPHKVLGDSISSVDGHRHAMPWCPPPVLCGDCLRREGGSAKIHAGCKGPAAESQARADAAEARWLAGEPIRVSAIRCDDPHGDWTRVHFRRRLDGGRTDEIIAFVPGPEYRAVGYGTTTTLGDYPGAVAELPSAVPA